MEIYKDIKGYEGIYQISNLGNIRSLNYNKFRILKLKNDRGYFTVCLCKQNIKKQHSVHRLVANTFIYNLQNKPQVNHINGIKTDNNINNLEWCTCKENIIHSWKSGLSKTNEDRLKKVIDKNSIKVINIITNEIFSSIKEASLKSDYNEKSLGYQINKSKNNKSKFIKYEPTRF